MLLFGYHPFDSSLYPSSTDVEDENYIEMSVFGETAQEDLKNDEGDTKDIATCWNVLKGKYEIPAVKIGSGDLEGENHQTRY